MVDGDSSEWDEYHSSGATDPSVIWNFGWDSDTLYIGLKVPLSGFFDTPSQGKVIVLYFDTTLPTDDEPTNSFGTAQGRLYGDQVTKGRSDLSASISFYSFPPPYQFRSKLIYIIFVPLNNVWTNHDLVYIIIIYFSLLYHSKIHCHLVRISIYHMY